MADTANRATVYADVTAKIIAELEAGRLPWVQPWKSNPAGATLPVNASTGRRYSEINVLLLWGAGIGYGSQQWLTFKQALELGGNVRKGEHGTTVVYADRFVPAAEARRVEAGEIDTAKGVHFLKRFTVFNVAQCEKLPERITAEPIAMPERQIVPRAEALLSASGATIRIGGDRAFYIPSVDAIQLPPQPAFVEQINYYRTAFHELGHWTGHPTRLARDFSGRFGNQAYTREELVAEICAAFTCASLGIQPTVRHADYIATWLDVLRSDDKAIFRAASMATKAADFILAFEHGASAAQPEALAA